MAPNKNGRGHGKTKGDKKKKEEKGVCYLILSFNKCLEIFVEKKKSFFVLIVFCVWFD